VRDSVVGPENHHAIESQLDSMSVRRSAQEQVAARWRERAANARVANALLARRIP
jgi:hypothetical protein